MDTPARNGYTVEIQKIEGIGTTWIVRVYKKILFFRKRVSSDWFLDGLQAERYATQLRGELEQSTGIPLLKNRKPGWVLRRPVR
jgi:hypothetical protein